MKKKEIAKLEDKPEKSKGGRPSGYSAEIADLICERIANSSQGLNKICEADDMPSEKTVYNWIDKHPEFLQMYSHARARQADYIVSEILDIADETSKDTITVEREGGSYDMPDTEWINRSKLRITARMWLASKLNPKKYGDKLEIDAKVQAVPVQTYFPAKGSLEGKKDA